jgi:hypothetical protein
MSDYNEELWRRFIDEAQRLWNRLADDGAGESTVDLYSLGQMAEAMGFPSVSTLADRLAVALDRGLAFDDPLAVEAVDRLNEGLTAMMVRRIDLPSSALTERLARYAPQETAPKPSVAISECDPGLAVFFGVALKERLADLAPAFAVGFDIGAPEGVAVSEGLNALKESVAGSGFHDAEEALGRLEELFHEATGDIDDDRIARIVWLLAALRGVAERLESGAGVEVAGSAFETAFGQALERHRKRVAAGAQRCLAALAGAVGPGGIRKEGGLLALRFDSLADFAVVTGVPAEGRRLFAALEEGYGRLVRGEMDADPRLDAAAREALSPALTAEAALVLEERVRRLVAESVRRGGKPRIAVDDLIAMGIDRKLIDLVTPDTMRLLDESLDEGWRLYRIDADLLSDEEGIRPFIRWLEFRSRVIASRGVAADGRRFYQFLVAAQETPERLAERLALLDGGRGMIRFDGSLSDAARK